MGVQSDLQHTHTHTQLSGKENEEIEQEKRAYITMIPTEG